jgi:hypothetical protein
VSAPLFLGPLADLQGRSFAFYPAIVGLEHNQWTLRRATWTDVQAVNTKTGTEVWVPRRLLGEISSVEAPVLIVGLVKELQYKEGAVVPHQRRVLEMPRAVNGPAVVIQTAAPARPAAPVVAIRAEPDRASPARRWIRGGAAAGILACIAAGFLVRDTPLGARYGLRAPQFGPRDTYDSIVGRLGRPYSDQRLRTPAGAEYRRLWYPRRSLAVILAEEHYAGSLDSSGHVLHEAAPAMMKDLFGNPF